MKNLETVKIIILFFAISMISTIGISQTVTVDGYAFLENETNHEGIQIVFERVAPGSLFDTIFTDVNGYYEKEINTGIYNIHYFKEDYIPLTLNETQIYSNITLSDTTLETIGIGGYISGILEKGTYKVGTTLTVGQQDTLIIEAGTKLLFKNYTRFIVNGLLLANGSQEDTIAFTSYDTTNWSGLKFYNSNNNSKLLYCIIENSDSSGIRIISSSPELSDIVVRNNSNLSHEGAEDGGGGIYFNNSNTQVKNATITNNYSAYAAGVFLTYSNVTLSNSIVSNNICFPEGGGGGFFLRSYSTLSLTNVVVSGNIDQMVEATYAHGIDQGPECYVEMNNCIISNNEGRGIKAYKGSVKMKSCIVSQNVLHGIGYLKTNVEISNSIISYNNDFGIYNSPSQPDTTCLLNNNDIYGNTNGNFINCGDWYGLNVTINNNGDSCDAYNNILLPPQFVDTTNNNFHFLETSPCIDAGTNDSVNIEYDLDGNIRIWDGNNNGTAIVDMGAYEYGSVSYFPPTSAFNCPDNVCINEIAFIEYTGNASDTANYYWDFDGGVIVSGSTQGPYQVLWSEGGEKSISLLVEENGLNSVTTTNMVNVIPQPTAFAGQDTTIVAGSSYTISDAETENYETLYWITSGDGTFNDTSFLNPVYTPGQNDIYNGNVLLILEVNSICGIANDDIILNIEHMSLSGSVYAGSNFLESGVALLFDINQNYYLPVEYTPVSNGIYSFEGLSLGNYIVYAIPNPFEITGYFPTYYVNQLFWWNAFEIDLFGNAYDVDIHLVEIPDGTIGNGSISGVITYESNEVYEEDIYGNDWFGNTTGAPYGAWNMPVFLYDDMSNPIAWVLSNESGVFEFVDIPFGQYTLTMEKAGFQLSGAPNIILDESNSTVSNIGITIKPQDVTIDVPETTFTKNNEFVVFPNPVANELNIKFDTNQKDLTIELFNIAGQKVLSKQVNNTSQNFKIDVSELEIGIYLGRIKTKTQNHFFKILK